MQSINLNSESMVRDAYVKGVTMGSDLGEQENKIPEFIVWAQRDKKWRTSSKGSNY